MSYIDVYERREWRCEVIAIDIWQCDLSGNKMTKIGGKGRKGLGTKSWKWEKIIIP